MSFVHKTAPLMTVRSASFMSALHVFWDICVTQFVEVSLSKLHAFYITVLKIIYVYSNGIYSIYETYIRGFRQNESHRKISLKNGTSKRKRKENERSVRQAILVFSQLRPSQLLLLSGFQ